MKRVKLLHAARFRDTAQVTSRNELVVLLKYMWSNAGANAVVGVHTQTPP